jgi:hypothetical protein
MNKRDKAQLKAAIAKDLVQGQGAHSPTRELLRQYAPLEGIITTTPVPVENSTAPPATVARKAGSPWHGATVESDATVASPATVERYAEVKGELRVPNTISFSVFPTLDPFARAIYYQLFLLSHGFKRETCIAGLAKLARSVLMSQRKVQDTVTYLERRGLIRRVGSILGGPSKGNVYQVPLPATDAALHTTVAGRANVAPGTTVAPRATLAPETTVARRATNKDDDDDFERKSSSKGRELAGDMEPVENHSEATPPRERQDAADHDFAVVRAAYEKATGNRWTTSDSEAYTENQIATVPLHRILSVLESVPHRTPAKINSFNYFIKEIAASQDPRNRAWQKKQLEKIVQRVRDNAVGRNDYSMSDFVEDVKRTCARENVVFDNDMLDELVR